AEKNGLEVLIVTNDKDMNQLVTENVKVLRTERTGEMNILDATAVEEKMGVPPERVVELLGLWGDTIDNIPGAPGIGEKGAKQLIQQYGTVENAIAHADEISRKNYRESLKNNVELIRQSRELVKIACDLKISIDLKTLIYEAADRRAAYELFRELEFAALVKEYSDAAEAADVGPTVARRESRKANYSTVATRSDLERLLGMVSNKDRIGLSVAEHKTGVYGIAIAPEAMRASLVDFDKFEPKQDPVAKLKEVLENGGLKKAVHDWKGTLTALDQYVCQREADSAPLIAFAKECNGEIQDFTPAVRIHAVEDD